MKVVWRKNEIIGTDKEGRVLMGEEVLIMEKVVC